MHDFLWAFLGGALLGISVVGYLYINGKIAGISGMIGQIIHPEGLLQKPAFWFLLGIVVIPFIYGLFIQPEIVLNASIWQLIVAGLLVGFGTRLGSGCTSGHGICGISRLSKRSLIATGIFMLTGAITVFVVRHVVGAGA
ncbi:YeeE/YedE family protein [Acinetobacter cumulans]|uniref:YeeE/YedE family protein n=1 Tax=Acinetobacter cumulans TaxID=2136182 RepID=A0A3A8G2U2_9GAMM|nr:MULTISPECIES: YeeE/YedE family protein [Acinetobacter]NWK75905.1 YeeE/YedE family protein [Acinetobacter sp. SwsAc6]QCO22097.1 YeeE/YedE family protein [Acinetobacter cumulans]RFS27722.1 YeeE/YedE family protein [Acinetobacter sp. SWAC5]RKG41277.1 YeeE/YedE family protein [Acinetobacter cumulans]RKG46581.1 YeeE/YedE family protein [Acinetobacter cumulans]